MKLLQGPMHTTRVKTRKSPIGSDFKESEKRKEQTPRTSKEKGQKAEEVDILPVVEKSSFPENLENGRMTQELHSLLSQLVENTSSISKELGAIRRTFEK